MSEPLSSQNEREQLSQDIERMKFTLRASGAGEFSEEEYDDSDDALHVDSEWEDEEDDNVGGDYQEAGTVTEERTLPSQSDTGNEDFGDETDVPGTDYEAHQATTSASIAIDPGGLSLEAAQLLASAPEDGELPDNAETCLAMNRAYQEILVENLRRMDLVLAKNRETQASLKIEMESEAQEKISKDKRRPMSVFAIPYIKDTTSGKVPLPNKDALMKKVSSQLDPSLKPIKIWSVTERNRLHISVKQDILQQRMRPILNKKELLLEKQPKAKTVEEEEQIKDDLQKLNDEMNAVRALKDSKQYGSSAEDKRIDWLKICSTDFGGTRSAANCQLMWLNALKPSITTTKWKAAEEQDLQRLVDEHKERNWQQIAEELDTGRTAFQCLQRYQTRLNPWLQTGKWTPVEDILLREVVESVTVGDKVPWKPVAYYMEGRSWEQCQQRWRVLNPPSNIRRGKWTEEEDLTLIEAVKRFGSQNWTKVKDFVPERTSQQCRERWVNCLNGSVKFGSWSYEEDKKLWLLTDKLGFGKWAEIAQHIPGRVDNACLQRYRTMQKMVDQEKLVQTVPESVRPKSTLPSLRAFIREEMDKMKRTAEEALGAEEEPGIPNQVEADLNSIGSSKLIHTAAAAEQRKLKKRTLQKKSNLAVIETLKKQYEERLKAEEEEKRKVDIDRKNGIYVPRPSCGVRANQRGFAGLVQRRKNLHSVIMHRIQKAIKTGHERDIKAESTIYRLVTGENIPFMSKKICHKAKQLRDTPHTIQQILNIACDLKKEIVYKGRRPPGRPKLNKEEGSLEMEIMKTLRIRLTRKSNVGRPKKFLAQDLCGGNKSEPDNSEDLCERVANLLFTALNFDLEGSVRRVETTDPKELMASAINVKTQPVAPDMPGTSTSSTTDSSQDKIDRLEQDITLMKNVTDYNRFAARFRMQKRPSDGKQSESSVPGAEPPLGSAEDGSVSQGGERAAAPPAPPAPLPPRRKALQGENAAKAYHMPPLPPMVCTINAFKLFLLNRRKLLKSASRFSIPGELGTVPAMSARKAPLRRQRRPDEDYEFGYDEGEAASASVEVMLLDAPVSPVICLDAKACAATASSKTPVQMENSNEPIDLSTRPTPNSPEGVTAPIEPGCSVPGQLDEALVRSLELSVSDPNAKQKTKGKYAMLKPEDIDLKEFSHFPAKDLLQARRLLQQQAMRVRVPAKSPTAANNPADPAECMPPNRKGVRSSIQRIRLTHDYQLLRSRISSLFIWPALLSTIPVTPAAAVATSTSASVPKSPSASAATADGDDEAVGGTDARSAAELSKDKKRRKYPCSRGKRYRKFVMMARGEKKVFKEKIKTIAVNRVKDKEGAEGQMSKKDAETDQGSHSADTDKEIKCEQGQGDAKGQGQPYSHDEGGAQQNGQGRKPDGEGHVKKVGRPAGAKSKIRPRTRESTRVSLRSEKRKLSEAQQTELARPKQRACKQQPSPQETQAHGVPPKKRARFRKGLLEPDVTSAANSACDDASKAVISAVQEPEQIV